MNGLCNLWRCSPVDDSKLDNDISYFDREHYKYCVIDEKRYAVDRTTGELLNTNTVCAPDGGEYRSKEQREAGRQYFQMLRAENENLKKEVDQFQKEEMKRTRTRMKHELGHFYFLLRENKLGKLSPETLARLMYLCTFLPYNKTAFMRTKRTPMKKEDLAEVLHVSERTAKSFWTEVSPTYIKSENNQLYLVTDEIAHGSVNTVSGGYQKCYIDCVKSLYEQIDPAKHKHLGYVFQLLPYINIEYNVLCKNPYEKNKDEIEPLTLGEICTLIGYEKKNASRLRRTYNQITVKVKNNRQEYFIGFSGNEDDQHKRAFVNPRVIYSGSDYKQVEVFYLFLPVIPKNTEG